MAQVFSNKFTKKIFAKLSSSPRPTGAGSYNYCSSQGKFTPPAAGYQNQVILT